jgi:hypothetical protein
MNDKIIRIQNELKVPKAQFNKFGGYAYRSCEDILEALKPLLAKEKLLLFLTDRMVNVGNRNYVRACATLVNSEGNILKCFAYAREDEMKKGMSGDQLTGSASSYARKYALNGLFLIDDTKDSDSNGKGTTQKEVKNVPQATVEPNEAEEQAVCTLCQELITIAEKKYSLKYYNKPLCRDCQKIDTGEPEPFKDNYEDNKEEE